MLLMHKLKNKAICVNNRLQPNKYDFINRPSGPAAFPLFCLEIIGNNGGGFLTRCHNISEK